MRLVFPRRGHGLDLRREEIEARSDWGAELWTFSGWAADPVTAEVTFPRQDPWGLIISAHGATGSRQVPYVQAAARRWARRGLITAAPDAPLHGARSPCDPTNVIPLRSPRLFVQAVGDLFRLVDAIAAAGLGDLPLGFLGFSMGALVGTAFLSEGAPVEAAALVIGGSTAAMGEATGGAPMGQSDESGGVTAAATDPLTYAPEVRDPWVLMMNADADEVFDRRAAMLLYDAFGCRKQIVFFPGTHGVWRDPAERYDLMLGFFGRRLGDGTAAGTP